MRIKLLLWALLTGAAFGQAFPGTVRYVLVAPSGNCIAGAQSPLTQVINGAGTVYACQSITAGVGTWTALASAGASGTVTNVSVASVNGVSGTVTNPTTTPVLNLSLGVITPTSVNGLTLATRSIGFSVAGGTTSKTLTINNTVALSGNDSSTLNIAAGGTLGSAAFTPSTNYCAVAGCTMSGTIAGTSLTLSTPLAVASGGNGTATPAIVAGTNITVSGTWPNQTINATSTPLTFQQNSVNLTSSAGLNFLNSSANSVGLTATVSNPGTNQVRWEITGGSYTGNSATATQLSGCTLTTAGDLCIFNGSSYVRVAGNNSGTKFLQENASGVASFGVSTGATLALDNLASVAVSAALTPGSDNAISLDSATKRYINGIFSGVVGGTDGAGTLNGGISFPVGGSEVDVGNGTAGNITGTLKAALGIFGTSVGIGTPSAACTGASDCIAFVEAAGTGTPTASNGYFRMDTSHAFLMSLNNGAEFKSAMNLPIQGTDANALSSGTISASAAIPLCTDANHGATTSGCPSPGPGTVTVVASGNLTSTALTTGGGTQTMQTPCATCTLDASGNLILAAGGSLKSADTGTPGFTFATNKITINQPVTFGTTSNQIVLGTTTNLTTLTFPASSGAVTLTFPLTSQLMVGANSDTTTTHVMHATAVAGVGSFSALVAADIPTLIPIANIGTAGLSGTSPISISGAGAIACTNCVQATSPGVGIAHFAGSTQTVTSSAVVDGDISFTNPALGTGPTASTQSAKDNSTKVATTAYVDRTTPLTTGTSVTLTAPRQYFVCTGTCTITVPVPAAGYEFCVLNDDNVATVITMSAIGSSARYENTARTAYGTAGTGTFVSGGAVGDKVCLLGRDSTHYLTASFNGTWVAN